MTVRDVENIKPSHIIKSPTWQEFQHQLKDPRYMEHFAQLDAQFARHFMATNSGKSILAKDDSTSQKKDEDVKIVPDEKDTDNDVEPTRDDEIVNKDQEGEASKNSRSSASGGGQSSSSRSDSGDGSSKQKPPKDVPEVYPQMLALPIARRPLFPGFYKAVVISDERVMKAIKEMLDRQQPYIGAFMLKNSEEDTDVITDKNDVYDVGVLAQITSAFPSKDEKTGTETMTALLYPHRRIKIDELFPPNEEKEKSKEQAKDTDTETTVVEDANNPEDQESTSPATPKLEDIVVERIPDSELQHHKRVEATEEESEELDDIQEGEDINPTEFLKNYNVSLVNVLNLEDEPFDRKSPVINALTSEILKVFKEISQLNTMFREQIATFSASIQSATTNIFEEPARLADFAAAVSAGEEDELQDILSSLNIEHRLEKSLLVLKKELMNAELQNKISKDVETKIQKRQREYYLMEQLKGIKRELGIDDGRDKLIDTYKERIKSLKSVSYTHLDVYKRQLL